MFGEKLKDWSDWRGEGAGIGNAFDEEAVACARTPCPTGGGGGSGWAGIDPALTGTGGIR